MALISTVPIGAAKGDLGATISGYADYLHSGRAGDLQIRQPSRTGAIRYYADTVEGPGIWNGTGARHLGLEGQVDREDFESLLHGRDHITGERLVSAQGSAGRRELKVGTPTRDGPDGQPLWNTADTAAHFELDATQLAKVLSNTEIDGQTQINGDTYFTKAGILEIQGTVDADDELRYERASVGDGNDILSTKDVAELTGVSQRHVQNMAKYYEANKDDIEAADPEQPGDFKQWIKAERGGNRGQSFEITRESVLQYLDRRQPPAVRAAYDATLSIEKSVSILALMSDGDVHDQVIEAYEAAVSVALDHLNEHASNGRAKGESIGSEGLVVASFTHSTTRSLDPSLHTHNVVVNAIVDENGEGRTPDGRLLYSTQSEAAALATTELRHQLQDRLGIDFYQRDNGVWEVAGIPDTLIKEFSQRSSEIDTIARELADASGEPISKSTRQTIAHNSKAPKEMPSAAELQEQWWARANGIGFTKADLASVQDRRQASTQYQDHHKRDLFRHLDGPEGATANASVFTKADTLKAVTRFVHSYGNDDPRPDELFVMSAKQARDLANEWLASQNVIPLALSSEAVSRKDGRRSGHVQGRQEFTTVKAIQTQQAIGQVWGTGLNPARPSGVATANDVNAAVANHTANSEHPLTTEQEDLVRIWTQSGQFAQAAVGRPGTGKTTTMKVAVAAWERSGYTVHGASVKGEAARHLGAEAGIDSKTVAMWIANQGSGLDSNSVLIVDEASTLSDDDLHQLLEIAQTNSATIRFIGDPAQHGSVGAGGMWGTITRAFAATTPEVTVQHRLQQPHERQAIEELRHGNVDEAFRLHKDAGTLIEVDNTTDAAVATIRRAMQLRDEGKPHPIIERRNDRRKIINDVIQRLRVDRGDVTQLTEYGVHQFGVGDDVIARSNNRDLHPETEPDNHVRNGSPGIINAIDNKGRLTVDFDGLGEIEIDPELIANGLLDLRYSLTSYGVQGATFEASTATKQRGASTNETIVDMSRGKQENAVYVVRDDAQEGAQFAEPSSTTSLAAEVAASIKANNDTPSTLADPDIAAVAATDQAMPDQLRVHRRASLPGRIGLRVEQVQQARLALRASTNNTLTDKGLLPERPDTPWLAKLWDNATAATNLYQHTYSPNTTNKAPWGTVLGYQPSDPSQRSDWTQTHQTIAEAATAIANRVLAQSAVRPTTPDDTSLAHAQPDLGALDEQNTAAASAVRSATDAVDQAAQALDNLGPKPASRFRRTARKHHEGMTESLTTTLNTARQSLDHATAHHRKTKKALDAGVNGQPTTNPDREATIAHETKTNPPSWMTDRLVHLSAHGNLTQPAIHAVGEWATRRAIYTERWGTTPSEHAQKDHQLPTAQALELRSVNEANTAIDAATKEPPLRQRVRTEVAVR